MAAVAARSDEARAGKGIADEDGAADEGVEEHCGAEVHDDELVLPVRDAPLGVAGRQGRRGAGSRRTVGAKGMQGPTRGLERLSTTLLAGAKGR